MNIYNILIIEDEPTWANDIERALLLAAKKTNSQVKFHYAQTTNDAFKMIHAHHYHGISIDQNMPDKPGAKTTREKGKDFVDKLEQYEPPGFMAIYTNYPAIHMANFAGTKASIPYKVKSTKDETLDDGQENMTTASYGEYFFEQVRKSYISRVLNLVSLSGFTNLRDLANDVLHSYGIFNTSGFAVDDHAKNFFFDLGKFREHFAISLASFLYGLARSYDLKARPPKDTSRAKIVDDWLRKTLDGLETKQASAKDMAHLRAYFQLPEGTSIARHFVSASEEIREMRNQMQHPDWRYTPEEFWRHLDALFRFFDMVAWLMRRPLINQPYKTRSNYLSYSDLNYRRGQKKEIFSTTNLPVVTPERVFTFLADGERLISLDHGLTAKRDERSNRRLLKQEIV